MRTLFPPLQSHDGEKSVLPDGIRSNFEALQGMLKNETRELSEKDTKNKLPNVESCKKRKRFSDCDKKSDSSGNDDTNFEQRKIRLAAATVAAVENEISRLSSGIAELEALLLQQDGGESDADIAFPPLPSIIPDDGQENGARLDSSLLSRTEMIITKSNTE